MSSPKENKVKKGRKIQPTLFGIKKFEMTQKATKKVGKNQHKVIGEFVRKEKEETKMGVFTQIFEICTKEFKTANAKGVHMKREQERKKKVSDPSMEKSCIFVPTPTKPPDVKRNASEKDTRSERFLQASTATLPNQQVKKDHRSNNRGSSHRHQYSSRYKVEFVDDVN